MNASRPDVAERFLELVDIVVRLRSPGGCPWDRAQKKDGVGRYVIEEAYEVVEAIEEGIPEHVREELGDLLFQILFIARMAEEEQEFDLEGVMEEIIAKMIRRHPHVFGETTVEGVEEIRTNWERIKKEVEHKGEPAPTLLGAVPRSLSTLAQVQRITDRASDVGFDWPDAAGVLEKVEEELAEFRAALAQGEPKNLQEEAGDLLFTLVNLCRFVEIDAETALRGSLRKFVQRFSQMERRLAAEGKAFRDVGPAEMNRIWDEAKTTKGIAEEK